MTLGLSFLASQVELIVAGGPVGAAWGLHSRGETMLAAPGGSVHESGLHLHYRGAFPCCAGDQCTGPPGQGLALSPQRTTSAGEQRGRSTER